jgi:tetratricopeptide (TPR) repeat protein
MLKAIALSRILICTLLLFLTGCAGQLADTDTQSAYDAGLALFNQGNYGEALPEFKQAVELDPEFGSAYLYLGRTYLNLGKWRDAIPPLRTAHRMEPQETRR